MTSCRSIIGVLVLAALGCAKPAAPSSAPKATPPAATASGPTASKEDIAIFKQLGLAYQLYNDAVDIGPSKPEDLGPFLENDPRFLKPLGSGAIVLVYKVKTADLKEPHVLAYTRDTPTKGGLVLLLADKSDSIRVVEMSAEEFKKAKLAKPEAKKE